VILNRKSVLSNLTFNEGFDFRKSRPAAVASGGL
jgi:hypothetical protein